MAKAQQNQPVDLFGNPRLSPRQVLQQQLAEIMKDTAEQTARSDPRTQGVSMMGSALGGLLRNAMIDKGVLPKPPEVERAEKMEALDAELMQNLERDGLTFEQNPTETFDRAAAIAVKAGMPDVALQAIQRKQLHEAEQRAVEMQKAQLTKTRAESLDKVGESGYTSPSADRFLKTGDASGLERDPDVPKKGDRGEYFKDVVLADGSVVSHNARTGKFIDASTGEVITDKKRLRGAKYDPALNRKVEAGKTAGQEAGKEQRLIDGKLDALTAISQGREMLEAGIYSGGWADWKMKANKLGPFDKTKAANTERFQAYLGDVIIPGLKEFGGNDSNEERAYLEKVRGGQITMEEPALRKILETAERKITRGLARARKRANEAGLPDDRLPEETLAPASGAQFKDGATATNPKTGAKIIFKGGKWQPL